MITLHTLASGSEGNCLLLRTAAANLLIDAGISCRRIKTALDALGVALDDVDAIFITHEHSDHIKGLATLVKHHHIPIYASAGTGGRLCSCISGIAPLLHIVHSGDTVNLGDAQITAFATSHDSAQSMDYRIDCGDCSAGILTDTGYVTDAARQTLSGVRLLVLESNHDVDQLRSGPYPYSLQQRILGSYGHLCNEDAAAFAVDMVRQGTQEIILAHLSRENNTPLRALTVMDQTLALAGLSAAVSVAPRQECSRPYRVMEVTPCRK